MSNILRTQCSDSQVAMAMDDLAYPHCIWTDGLSVKYAKYYGEEWRTIDNTAIAFSSSGPVSLSKNCIGTNDNGECFFALLDDQDLKVCSWNGKEWITETAWENANSGDVLAFAVVWTGFPTIAVFTRSNGSRSVWIVDKSSGSWCISEGVSVPPQNNDIVELKTTRVLDAVYLFWNGKDLFGESWIGHIEWDTVLQAWESTADKIALSEATGDIAGIDFTAIDEGESGSSVSSISSESSSSVSSGLGFSGGYLTWILRKTNGRAELHGCRVNQAVEYPLTSGSRIDLYEPSVQMTSDGFCPFYPLTSVYVDGRLNPKIVCMSIGLEMFAIEGKVVENKSLDVDLFDRPTIVVSKKTIGSNSVSLCMKIANGDVYFTTIPETADLSSSSSSMSSLSSSSRSSVSSSSKSSRTYSSVSSVSSSSRSSISSKSSKSSSSSSLSSLSSMSSSSISSSSVSSLSSSSSTEHRFTDNIDGTVTDNKYNLMWTKSASNGIGTWAGSIGYCNGLSYAGYTDWRLPTETECHNLGSYGLPGYSPFTDIPAPGALYWTITEYDYLNAYAVAMREGTIATYAKNYNLPRWPVRNV